MGSSTSDTQKCTRCFKVKPLEEYEPKPSGGLRSRCHECMAKSRAYYEKTKDRQKAAAKTWTAENREKWNARRRQRNRDNPAWYLFTHVRRRAKSKGIPFTLTLADVVVPEVCPILGIPLVMGDGHARPNSPSIDRIDPTKGYVPGNVHVISNRANTIKNDASIEDLRKVLTYLEGLL